jgi:hypothetical protein
MIKARLAVFAVLSIALSLCEPAYACRGPSGQPSKSLRNHWCENLEEKLEPCKFGDGLSRHYFSHHWWLGRGMNFVQVPRASGVSHQLSETLIQCTVKH